MGIPLALVLGGLALAIVGRKQRISANSFQRQKQLLDVEIDRRLRGRSQLEQELQEKEHALAQLMVEYTLLKKTYALGTAAAGSKGSTSRGNGGKR